MKLQDSQITGNPESILYLDYYRPKRDKLQLPEESSNSEEKQRLLKRAERKAKSLPMFQELIELDNNDKRQRQYERSLECANIIEVDRNGIIKTWNYCRHRLCPICHAIRQARYVDKYSPLVKGLPLYFLTLTLPAIQTNDTDELRKYISTMEEEFTRIINTIKKRNLRNGERKKSVDAVRKIEVGYRVQHGYTPHLHVLVNGSEIAEQILDEWLSRFSDASPQGQELKSINAEEINEVFGYAIKLLVDRKRIPVVNIDMIIAAMSGKREIQPYGRFRGVKVEEDPNKEATFYKDRTITPGNYVWDSGSGMWIEKETGELLVDF